MDSIAFPSLSLDTAILGDWRPENKFRILVNYLNFLFKFFIYKIKNHNFTINIYKFKLFTMSGQKVEQKLLTETINPKYTQSVKQLQLQFCHLWRGSHKYLPLPHVIARQSVSICMLLQSGVLSAKKSQNNNLFSVFWHIVIIPFAKTAFCKTVLIWH